MLLLFILQQVLPHTHMYHPSRVGGNSSTNSEDMYHKEKDQKH